MLESDCEEQFRDLNKGGRYVTRAAIVILPAFTCIALFGRAESKPAKSDPAGNEEQRVLAIQQQWADAEVKHDAPTLNLILADDFVVSYPSGKPLDKAGFIAQAMNLSMAYQIVSCDVIRIHGNTAVIVGTTIIQPLDRAAPAQSYRYTTVYQKRQGRWVGIAEQVGPGRAVEPPSAGKDLMPPPS